MKTAISERKNFSNRLRDLLQKKQLNQNSPTALARHFNVLHSGEPVTVHAARKWLVGEAIPTQEKLMVLASWLGTSLEYLRYGSGESVVPQPAGQLDPRYHEILADLRRMDERQQALVREFMRMVVQHDLQPTKARERRHGR